MSFPIAARTREARRSSRGKSGTCWTSRERRSSGWPCISLYQRILKKDGTLGKLKPLHALAGRSRGTGVRGGPDIDWAFSRQRTHLRVLLLWLLLLLVLRSTQRIRGCAQMFDILMPKLCASRRLGWLPGDDVKAGGQIQSLTWDDGPAWKPKLNVAQTSDQRHWELSGRLEREGQFEDLSRPLVLLHLGLVVFPDRIAAVRRRRRLPLDSHVAHVRPFARAREGLSGLHRATHHNADFSG